MNRQKEPAPTSKTPTLSSSQTNSSPILPSSPFMMGSTSPPPSHNTRPTWYRYRKRNHKQTDRTKKRLRHRLQPRLQYPPLPPLRCPNIHILSPRILRKRNKRSHILRRRIADPRIQKRRGRLCLRWLDTCACITRFQTGRACGWQFGGFEGFAGYPR